MGCSCENNNKNKAVVTETSCGDESKDDGGTPVNDGWQVCEFDPVSGGWQVNEDKSIGYVDIANCGIIKKGQGSGLPDRRWAGDQSMVILAFVLLLADSFALKSH